MAQNAGSSLWARPFWKPLAIAALAALCYLNSLGNGFHYDDTHTILLNHHVRELSNIPEYFISSHMFSAEPAMAMYRPLLQASFALNYAIGGYDPRGYHVVNLLLHAAAACLVYRLALGLLRNRHGAWWAGAVFAVHPIHTQAVNYVSSRSELMAAVGVLLALCLAVGAGRTGWGTAAYAAGLLAKSAAVAAAPLVVLAGYARSRHVARVGACFAVVTVAYVLVITSEGFLGRSLAQSVRPWGVHLLTQTKALTLYLKLLAMPVHLSIERAFGTSTTPWDAAFLTSLVLAGSLLYLGICSWRARQVWGLAILWFYAGLALTFLVPLNVLVSEHRLYLAAAGPALVAAAMATRGPGGGRGLALGTVLLLVLATLTWQRNGVWADDLSLWEDAAQRAPNAFRAQSNLGLALYEAGDLAAARHALARAVELNPRYAKTWSNLGLVLEGERDPEGAARAYGRSLSLRPDLAGVQANLGRLHLSMGQLDSARVHLEQALVLDADNLSAHLTTGRLHQQVGDVAAAEASYGQVLARDPRSAAAHNNLALLYEETGDLARARDALRQALEADPGYEEARVNAELLEARTAGLSQRQAYERALARFPGRVDLWLALGDLLLGENEFGAAAMAYESALERCPGCRGVRASLASAHHGAGRFEQAIAGYRLALDEDGPTPSLHANLASAYAAIGMLDEARSALEAALELDPDNPQVRRGLERLGAAARE